MKEKFNNIITTIKEFGGKLLNYSKNHPKTTIIYLGIIVLLILSVGYKIISNYNNEQYIPILNVKAKVSNNILSNNSTFVINTDLDYDIESVKKIIYLEPAIDYEVKKVGSKKYEITPTEVLSDNTVYTVGALRDETVVYRWAFQTDKKLSISSTYPRDGYDYVNTTSSIEITFSYSDIENIEEYFDINPKVEGKFVKENFTYKFIPSKKLEVNTKYTVTIKKELKNNFSSLEEDYSFTFQTSKDYSKNNYYAEYNYDNIDESYTFTTDVIPVVKLSDAKNITTINATIYKLKNAKEYIDNYKNKDNLNLTNLTKHSSITPSLSDEFAVFSNTLEEGYYIVNLLINNQSINVFIQINNFVTYLSNLENESLIWVNDYKSGNPIQDLVVNLDGNESKTDKDGIAIVKSKQSTEKYSFVQVGTNKTTPYVIMINNYEDNTYPNAYVYSDRTIYKKTDTIKVWGYVPLNQFNTPPTDDFKIKFSSYITKDIKVDENGIFETEISIADYKESNYWIDLTYKDSHLGSRYIEVYNYELPNYIYTITTDKNFYKIGDVITANIEVEHISGIKVPNKKVTLIDDYGNRYNITTDEYGKASTKIQLKTNTTHKSASLNYFQLKITSGDVEETSNYAEIKAVGVITHDTSLNATLKNSNTLEINTYTTTTDKLNNKYASFSYYIPESDFQGEKTERPITVQIQEQTVTKTIKGTKYNPITKTNDPEYSYNYNNTIVNTYQVNTVDGVAIINDLNYQNIITDEYNKTYYVIIKTTDQHNNLLETTIYIGDSYTYYYYIGDSSDTHYSFNTNSTEYNLNESIILTLEASKNYNIDGGKILSYFYKYGVVSKQISNTNDITYTYNKEIFPDSILSGAYFDGKRIYKVNNRVVRYNEEEQNLNINITTNKETTTPGSEITINVEVKDSLGKGKKAFVNISVVDEAVFMVRPDYTNILNNIYYQKYYHYYSYASYYDFNIDGGGAGDTEGEPDTTRKNFDDTAFFQTITTDASGKASVKVKLPDSTTTWRITAHAVNDTYVGVNTKKITATLPFFLQTNIPNAIKTTDDFVLNLTSFGPSGKVKYEVSVDDIKQNKDGNTGAYTSFNFGKLAKGNHKIKITGTIGSNKDSLETEFNVQESFVDIPITNIDYIENGKLNINATSSPVILEFYDTELEFYMKALNYLENTKGERVDLELANQKAIELKNKYYDEKEEINIIKLPQYQTSKGITLLKADSPSILISALMSKYGKNYINTDELREIFYNVITDAKSSEQKIYEAYVGLSALKEPVLFDLHYLKSQKRTDTTFSLFLAISYAFIGDYNTALDIYNKEIKNQKDTNEYLKAILTSMIDIEASKEIISKHLDNDHFNEYYTFAVIAYIENTIPLLEQKNIIKIDFNGSKETIELNRMMVKKLVIDKADIDNIKINTSKNVYVKTTYIGNYKDIKEENQKYQVTATINNKITKGKVTKLQINITNMEPKSWGTIDIHLPNGLRLSPEYTSKNNIYLTKNLNDYLVFNVYTKDNTSLTFDIDLIPINEGSFEIEPIIYKNKNNYGISNNTPVIIEK